MNRIVVILFILFFFIKENIYCQPYYFKHYQVENGLSNNTVLSSVQDNYGFMWFGTKDGLNRFDGYSFKVFRHDAEDSTSINDNYVRGLYKDKNGRIYAGTNNGISVYNELQENFTEFVKTRNTIREMTRDSSGNFWFVDNTTLRRIEHSTSKIYDYDTCLYMEIL